MLETPWVCFPILYGFLGIFSPAAGNFLPYYELCLEASRSWPLLPPFTRLLGFCLLFTFFFLRQSVLVIFAALTPHAPIAVGVTKPSIIGLLLFFFPRPCYPCVLYSLQSPRRERLKRSPFPFRFCSASPSPAQLDLLFPPDSPPSD